MLAPFLKETSLKKGCQRDFYTFLINGQGISRYRSHTKREPMIQI